MRLFIIFGPGRAFIMIWDGCRRGGVDGGGLLVGRVDGRSGGKMVGGFLGDGVGLG